METFRERQRESLEEVGLDCVWFPMKWRQNTRERAGRHTVCRLPGFQQVWGLRNAGGQTARSGPDARPRWGLETLMDRGWDGRVGEGGRRTRDRTGTEAARSRTAHVSRAGERRRAVGRRAARGLLRLIVLWWRTILSTFLTAGAASRCSGLGIGCTFLLAKFGPSVLEPNLRKKENIFKMIK